MKNSGNFIMPFFNIFLLLYWSDVERPLYRFGNMTYVLFVLNKNMYEILITISFHETKTGTFLDYIRLTPFLDEIVLKLIKLVSEV